MTTLVAVSDLYVYGAPASAFGSLSDGDKMKALDAAVAELEAAAAAQGKMPLLSPLPDDCKLKVIHVATYELMCRVGFNPGAGSDQNYYLRAVSARDYFKQISKSQVHPAFTFSAARNDRAQPQVRSKPIRGW